ncbi:hypothetical protein BJV78DRAFT_1159278 [Lactifluus subvellereus]|nr:hypothetical protein BJV78DRAFT_1159278 [Lactifluus subvellereus]
MPCGAVLQSLASLSIPFPSNRSRRPLESVRVATWMWRSKDILSVQRHTPLWRALVKLEVVLMTQMPSMLLVLPWCIQGIVEGIQVPRKWSASLRMQSEVKERSKERHRGWQSEGSQSKGSHKLR